MSPPSEQIHLLSPKMCKCSRWMYPNHGNKDFTMISSRCDVVSGSVPPPSSSVSITQY